MDPNEKIEGEKLNQDDFATGIEDLDEGINVMDQEAISQENEWQEQFTEESDEAPLPGKEEAVQVPRQAGVEEGTEEEEEEEELPDLTDDQFSDALSVKEKADLADLNARFGTDYKDMKSFSDKFKKEDGVDQEEIKVGKQRDMVQYLTKLKETDDEGLVFEDLRISAHQSGKDVNDPEVLQGLRDEVDNLVEKGVLKYAAKSLRGTVDQQLLQNQNAIQNYDNSKVQSKEQKETAVRESLKQATTKLYKAGKFYGIEVPQEQHMDVYRSASKGDLIKEMQSNPELLVEMTLLHANREKLAKLSNSPSFSAGIKATIDVIKGQKPTSPATAVTGKKSGSSLDSFIADFCE